MPFKGIGGLDRLEPSLSEIDKLEPSLSEMDQKLRGSPKDPSFKQKDPNAPLPDSYFPPDDDLGGECEASPKTPHPKPTDTSDKPRL